jgi:hypothetical protein
MDIVSNWPLLRSQGHEETETKAVHSTNSIRSSINSSDDSETPFLDDLSESDEKHQLEYPQSSRWNRVSLISLLLSLLIVGIVALWPTTSRVPDTILDCGNSPEEAAAKGCTFDILESAWVHPGCSDTDLQDQYNPMSIWTFYEDSEGTRRVSPERVESGVDRMLYTQPGFHQAHCVYIFDKMTRAILSRRPVNTRMLRAGHVKHCAMQMLILKHEFNESATSVGRNYLPCDWTYL